MMRMGLNVAGRMGVFWRIRSLHLSSLYPSHPLRCYGGFGDAQVLLSVMSGDPHPLSQMQCSHARAPVTMQTDISTDVLNRKFLHVAAWF